MVKLARVTRVVLLVLAASSLAFSGNLMTNGGFESGDISSWLLSTPLNSAPDFNCMVDTTTIYCPGTLDPSQVPANYIGAGNWGIFLGYPDGNGTQATLLQLLSLSAGSYNFQSLWGQHWTYTNEPSNEGVLEFVYGTSLGSLTSVVISSDAMTQTPIFSNPAFATSFSIPVTGDYYVGFRFYNYLGEWTVDNACLVTSTDVPGCNPVPEPSTLGLLAAPLAGLALLLRKKK